jgi:hypothetical protein
LYSSTIIRKVKSRRMISAGNVAHMGQERIQGSGSTTAREEITRKS